MPTDPTARSAGIDQGPTGRAWTVVPACTSGGPLWFLAGL